MEAVPWSQQCPKTSSGSSHSTDDAVDGSDADDHKHPFVKGMVATVMATIQF